MPSPAGFAGIKILIISKPSSKQKKFLGNRDGTKRMANGVAVATIAA